MCYCTPSIRTICCGAYNCNPSYKELVPSGAAIQPVEPVKIFVDRDAILDMRDRIKNAITPSIKYSSGMAHSEVLQQVEAERVNTLQEISKWLDDISTGL